MIKLSFTLSQGGRGIDAAMKRAAARTARAATRAVNAVGKKTRIDAREALSRELGVPAPVIRKVETARAAWRGSKNPEYLIRWSARGLPVRRSRHTSFEPYSGQRRGPGRRGRLVTKHWKAGKRIVLEGVLKRGRGYLLPASSMLPDRAVGGTRISRGSRPSRAALDPIRRTIRGRLVREFRAQLRRLPRR